MSQERVRLTRKNNSDLPYRFDSSPERSSEKMSESNPEETPDQASKTEEVEAQINGPNITLIDRNQHQGDITMSDVTPVD